MVPPSSKATPLEGFLRNFCADAFEAMPEAGGTSRTAQIQPGVYFAFTAPFVTIIVLYSNVLEDPGVISDADVGHTQLDFLRATLTKLKSENYQGAILFAHHHPGYTMARHGWSIEMQTQIDQVCDEVGLWPHADLAGHAHTYQRFTRYRADGTQVPYVVCGNGGHNVTPLYKKGTPAPRVPQIIQQASNDRTKASPLRDKVVFERYDDVNYGYLRVVVTKEQLRIEYHPAPDAKHTKSPGDSVTIDLATRKIATFAAPVIDHIDQVHAEAAQAAAAQAAGRTAAALAPSTPKAAAPPQAKRRKSVAPRRPPVRRPRR
jgi:hypothetical protein